MKESSKQTTNPNSASGQATDPVVIHSSSNERIRRIVRLRENNRARRRSGVVIVDGWRLVTRLIQLGFEAEAFFMDQANGVDPSLQLPIPPTLVSCDILRRIAFGQTESSVVGVFRHQTQSLADWTMPQASLILVADRIEKPGNLGAIYRTADAAGASGVVLCGGGDPGHPTAIRNSQAASLTLPTAAGSDADAASRFIAAGYQILAARVESSSPMDDFDLTKPTAIVVGNEAEGLAERWQFPDVAGIHIPMAGHVDSLNVSVSAAILLMEAARQRRLK